MLLILRAVSAVGSLLLVPAIVGKANPSSCNAKSLRNRPIHTINSKPSCTHAAVLEIWQLLACLHTAVTGISCSLCSLEEASLCQDSFLLTAYLTVIVSNAFSLRSRIAFKYNFSESMNILHYPAL